MSEETKSPTQKAYAAAYGAALRVFKDNYGKPVTLNNLPDLISQYKKAGNEKYTMDKNFPVNFYQQMSLVMIQWAIDHYRDCASPDVITPTYNAVWKVHKKYMEAPKADIQWDALMTEVTEAEKGMPKYIERMFMAVMNELEGGAKA